MNEKRRMGTVIILLTCLVFIFASCKTAPAVVVDTTEVDTGILEVTQTVGEVEVQVITVHDTVTKIIHQASPEDKAKIEKQFGELNATIERLKAMPIDLAKAHVREVEKFSKEIARLVPFEIEAEKQKAKKMQAITVAVGLALLIAGYVSLKVFKPLIL